MSNFHVGQKVTPKNDDPWQDVEVPDIAPVFGEIYTIRSIEYEGDGVYLRFHEIHNVLEYFDDCDCIDEMQFDADDFRPVIERKTDISIFKRLLVPASKQKQVA